MLDLNFRVEDVEAERYAVSPLLRFRLRITNPMPLRIQSIALQCQIRIEATRRQYGTRDRERLMELFGESERWNETLKSLLWTHASVLAPSFDESCTVDLPVPCSFDFNVAATKYFYGLEDGEVPLVLLFSGTVFYEGAEGILQLDQIPWSKEASYRLPLRAWQEMMDRYYPDTTWLRLSRDVFERVYRYKRQQGFPTFEQALCKLLDHEVTPA